MFGTFGNGRTVVGYETDLTTGEKKAGPRSLTCIPREGRRGGRSALKSRP